MIFKGEELPSEVVEAIRFHYSPNSRVKEFIKTYGIGRGAYEYMGLDSGRTNPSKSSAYDAERRERQEALRIVKIARSVVAESGWNWNEFRAAILSCGVAV